METVVEVVERNGMRVGEEHGWERTTKTTFITVLGGCCGEDGGLVVDRGNLVLACER